MDALIKPLHWVSSALDDLRDCPEEVQDDLGFALYVAQGGGKHESVKPLQGFGGAGVLEIVDNHDGDTYRAVYTVKFARAIYVLYVFQKKSKKGIARPKSDIDLVKSRPRLASEHYQQKYGRREL